MADILACSLEVKSWSTCLRSQRVKSCPLSNKVISLVIFGLPNLCLFCFVLALSYVGKTVVQFLILYFVCLSHFLFHELLSVCKHITKLFSPSFPIAANFLHPTLYTVTGQLTLEICSHLPVSSSQHVGNFRKGLRPHPQTAPRVLLVGVGLLYSSFLPPFLYRYHLCLL